MGKDSWPGWYSREEFHAVVETEEFHAVVETVVKI